MTLTANIFKSKKNLCAKKALHSLKEYRASISHLKKQITEMTDVHACRIIWLFVHLFVQRNSVEGTVAEGTFT